MDSTTINSVYSNSLVNYSVCIWLQKLFFPLFEKYKVFIVTGLFICGLLILTKYSMPFCLISEIIDPRKLIFNNANRSWILYYRGWIISVLNKKKAWNICFIICHQYQTRSGKIKTNKTQQISVKTQGYFCKNWTTTYLTTTPIKSFYIIFVDIILKSFVSEIINLWTNQ